MEPAENQNILAFTRYLYIVNDVKTSLLMAILNNDVDEALFWCYELYYSGYILDVFQMINNIYNEFYSVFNPHLSLFLDKIQTDWENKENCDCIIGTMVYNLINREHSISGFVEKYSNTPFNLVYREMCKPDHKFYVILEYKDIAKYKTVEIGENLRGHQLLKHVTRYATHEYANVIFEHEHSTMEFNELLDIYRNHWLYYAAFTPIWIERIEQYKGSVDHETKKIVFGNEDLEEEFYNRYNYEPDEQPMSIVLKNIGPQTEKKWTWTDFYEKYK